MRSRSVFTIALAATLGATAGCENRQAYGDANAIVVGMSEAQWNEMGELVRESLQPTIFTVRDEQTFRLTWQDPADGDWTLLRQFRQVLAVGSPDDEWLADAVRKVRNEGADLTLPAIAQTRDVWSRGQVVSLLLVPPGSGAETIIPLADSLQGLLDGQFRNVATARMYASGRNDSLSVQLEREQGFTFDMPRVYYWDRQDSVWIFRNDNPDPSELIRQIAVTWQSPIPEEFPTVDELVEWRGELVGGFYQDQQLTQLAGSDVSRGRLADREILQLQATWSSPPEEGWPMAGPVTVRAIACPEQDRLYLIDAWLYAPSQDKYQYMIQLETILNSFRCTNTAPAAAGAAVGTTS